MEKIDPIYNVYILIKEGDIINAKNKIESIESKQILKNLKGYNSLKLRLYIVDNDIDRIINLFDNNEMMSRDWVDLLVYLNNCNIFDRFLEKYLDKIININYNIINITDLYNNLDKSNFYNFIRYFEYKSLMINKYSDDNCLNVKSNYYLEDLLQLQIKKLNIVSLKINNNYKFILDGGNILYSEGGKLNNISYKRLLKYYNYYSKLGETLIILNKKHSKYINTLSLKANIYYSPYKENDDLYILYFSLINKANIISNDEYYDHIDKYSIKEPNFNFLKIYLEEKLIKLNRTNGYNYQENKTKVIQNVDNKIYIPCNNGFLEIY
jgi:hypothetical protein